MVPSALMCQLPPPLAAGVRLENLTALRRLNLVDDGDEPSALSLWSTLPPRCWAGGALVLCCTVLC